MFGGSSGSSPKAESNPNPPASSSPPKTDNKSPSPSPESPGSTAENGSGAGSPPIPTKNAEQVTTGEKRSGNGSPPSTSATSKRRSSGVSGKASSLIASAKNTLNFAQGGGRTSSDLGSAQTPIQKLGKEDPTLVVPQGQHNNAAGESLPGPMSTFRVGVWEDRNKKCRRTMEDTHAFLYNFLHTPAPALASDTGSAKSQALSDEANAQARGEGMIETDNGYFAIFDGHAGTFAADWCGKKLHIILEDVIKKNPNVPIPELLDQTFTTVDTQLEKLPLKNSGCTAAVAVMRWEDRVPSNSSQTGSQSIAPALAKAAEKPSEGSEAKTEAAKQNPEAEHAKLKGIASRQRVLYTANVGDARIILCRSGKALRLSYDHKGSDENEGKRISNAGGLILNSRVNGVLAVTRALGDSYMKDLVTGHPYTTETVIQPDIDEFIIIACDGLWDVCSDQEACDLVRNVQDPGAASKLLVDHALARFSTDNLSCMIVRFDKDALVERQANRGSRLGVEGDRVAAGSKISETEKIVSAAKKQIADGGPAVGVSASNSGRGHDPVPALDDESGESFTPTAIDGPVAEEPAQIDGEVVDPSKPIDSKEVKSAPASKES
ncbi:hypothetical protein diail_7889 [Diaporthe ilicicola]|nr:hypothetical protein diail_7889 [Diaporthe ilicicola]